MTTYTVYLPLSGVVELNGIEAASPEEAIEKALASDLKRTDVLEWQTHRQLTTGNMLHAALNEAYVEEEN